MREGNRKSHREEDCFKKRRSLNKDRTRIIPKTFKPKSVTQNTQHSLLASEDSMEESQAAKCETLKAPSESQSQSQTRGREQLQNAYPRPQLPSKLP